MQTFILLSVLVLFVGCSSVEPCRQEVLNEHVIRIDKDGLLVNTDFDEPYDHGGEKWREHINRVLDYKKHSGTDKIVLYFHGGLNSSSASDNRAMFWTPKIQDSGYHPIFVNWNSGLCSTYMEHLCDLRQGEISSFWGPLTSPFIFTEDIVRGLVRTPVVWTYNGLDFLRSHDIGKHNSLTQARRVHEVLQKDRTQIGEQNEFREVPKLIDPRNCWQKTGDFVCGVPQLALGFVTNPIFDTFGTRAWDVMKRRTEILFARPTNKPEEHFGSAEHYSIVKSGALMGVLNRLQEKQDEDESLEVVLVGHSMGTIIANKILERWPDIKFKRIIYMAGACSIDDVRGSVLPYLREHRETEFYNYMLHPVAETQESHFWGFGGTGSLLNQIDNLYENTVHEGYRTFGKWENVMNSINYLGFDSRDILDEEENKGNCRISSNARELKRLKIYLRTMPLDERYPTMHGEFDDPKFHRIGNFWESNFGQKGRYWFEPTNDLKEKE